MDQFSAIALDLVAIAVLAFAIYYPRHRRRDLAVALVGINVGVLAVSMVLGSSTVSAGLGLGLFGVLSIIRLRSRELEQNEIAYYFAALAVGLIAGLSGTLTWLSAMLVALVIATLALIDTPRLFRRTREQTIVLDRAYTDEQALRARVEELLGCEAHQITVRSLDLVSDTTTVDVRFTLSRPGAERAPQARLTDAAVRTDARTERTGGAR